MISGKFVDHMPLGQKQVAVRIVRIDLGAGLTNIARRPGLIGRPVATRDPATRWIMDAYRPDTGYELFLAGDIEQVEAIQQPACLIEMHVIIVETR